MSGVVLAVMALWMQAHVLAAAEPHPAVVGEDPADYTPRLVSSYEVPKPHVDAMARLGPTIYAGGRFNLISDAAGTQTRASGNFVAFVARNGRLRSDTIAGYSDPVFDGQIWAIAAFGDSVFVGGDFAMVNGLSRPRLVKISASTGAVDAAFRPPVYGGTVWDLKIWLGPNGSTPTLVVAGSMGQKLLALDPVTGANLKYFDLKIADALPGAWGGVAVYKLAIDPTGTRLVATGNFQTVAGQPRARLFVADISGSKAALHPWYYPGFARPCSSTHPRRIAYLQGVDFAPDGSYFVVTATGQVPLYKREIWPAGRAAYHTVCDAIARFDMADATKPVWINYTGGDSVWSAVATGAAVYVQGHFQWLDNPNGSASQDGGGAVRRLGIGAIDPVTGKALPWNPRKPGQIGGKTFLVTPAGLWVGSDSVRFAGEPRTGIAYVRLP